MRFEGEARGATLITDALFIRQAGGESGIKRVEAELGRLGCPLHYASIREMDWYPMGWRLLSLHCIKDIFNLDDAGVVAIADAAPRQSFIIRLMMQFFTSPTRFFRRFPAIWDKHFTVGRVEVPTVDEDNKFAIVRLHDFALDPAQCRYFEGYIRRAITIMFPGQAVEVTEQACMFNGDAWHEYRVSWEK